MAARTVTCVYVIMRIQQNCRRISYRIASSSLSLCLVPTSMDPANPSDPARPSAPSTLPVHSLLSSEPQLPCLSITTSGFEPATKSRPALSSSQDDSDVPKKRLRPDFNIPEDGNHTGSAMAVDADKSSHGDDDGVPGVPAGLGFGLDLYIQLLTTNFPELNPQAAQALLDQDLSIKKQILSGLVEQLSRLGFRGVLPV